MKKNYTVSQYLNRHSTGNISKATFDQRKNGYLGYTRDRAAVFIEQSSKHKDYFKPCKNSQTLKIRKDSEQIK